jgi:hypothetical protein
VTPDLDHATVSAHLRDHVAGGLDDATAAAVEAHLATCPECEAERRAVTALGREAPEPMSELERARLHAGVSAATGAALGAAARRAPRRRRWGARLAPALAAAAVLVVVLGGALLLQGDGSGGQGGRGAIAPEGAAPGRIAGGSEGGGAGGTARGADLQFGAPLPRFEARTRRADLADLRRLGRTGGSFVAVKQGQAGAGRAGLEKRSLERLARTAPEALASDVRECGRRVIESRPDPVVAAYGAVVELEGRRALVLGFAYGPGARLERFMLWAWPLGECATPLSYQAGRIRG